MAASLFVLVFLTVVASSTQAQTVKRTHLNVTTIMHTPFIRPDENGNFEGFIVDLLNSLSKRIGVTYSLRLVKDSKYGSLNADGTWNGMIGEVKRGEADLAAAALTVTSYRKAHIDYTYPFFATGLSILMKKSDIYGTATEDILGLSYFITPFSTGVWLLIIVAFLTVSLGFILLNLFNPYEWKQRVQRGEVKDPDETGDLFGLKESMWFACSTLIFQGYSRRPLSVAGRILALFWMIFVALTVASYVALMVRNPNLVVNFSEGRDINVTGLRSFTDQKFPITTIQGGSTQAHFRTTTSPLKMKVYANMKKTGFVSSSKQGVEWVKTKGVALVMERAMLQYYVNRDCELIEVGDMFASRHYSFAIQQDDDLRHTIDKALIEMEESGEIARMQWVWWRAKSPSRCRGTKVVASPELFSNGEDISKTSGLALQAFGGPLVFLLIGLILTALVCVVEIMVFKHFDKRSGVPFGNDEDKA